MAEVFVIYDAHDTALRLICVLSDGSAVRRYFQEMAELEGNGEFEKLRTDHQGYTQWKVHGMPRGRLSVYLSKSHQVRSGEQAYRDRITQMGWSC